jgi:hypothetical protein
LKAILENIEAENWDEQSPEAFIDLIIAAGAGSELLPHPEEPGQYLISRKGLQVLASVFEGGEPSVYELIAALDSHQRQQIEIEQPEQ